jgi:hypothetical protein
MYGMILTTDRAVDIVEFAETDTYKTLSGAVGGLIECVYLHHLNADMWINEEGKLNGSGLNEFATMLFHDAYGATDLIFGDVIITGTADEEGNTTTLTQEHLIRLLNS